MKHQLRKKLLVIACAQAMAVMYASNAFAQEANSATNAVTTEASNKTLTAAQRRAAQKKAEEEAQLEIIEVVGFAGSLEKAIERKRNASGVVDSIIAEDMGKMADSNIAEAMQRMTGIAIDRQAGEGTTISIRGLGPGLNEISMNGQTMSGAGSYDPDDPTAINDGVSFNTMSADILSLIEVIKTPQASTVEGSLGGRVNLRSRDPLDSKTRKITGGIIQTYNELSQNVDPTFKFGYVDQFFDNKFGVSFAASNERRRGRSDSISTSGWYYFDDLTHNSKGYEYMQEALTQDPNSPEFNSPDTSTPLYAYDSVNGVIYDSNDTVVDNLTYDDLRSSQQSVNMPARIQNSLSLSDNNRKNFSLNLSYQPTDELKIYSNSTYNKLSNTNDRSLLRFLGKSSGGVQLPFYQTTDATETIITRGINGMFSGADFDENGTVYRSSNLSSTRQILISSGTVVSDNFTTNVGFEFDNNQWVVSGRAGISVDESELIDYSQIVMFSIDTPVGFDFTHDYKRPEHVWGHLDRGGNELPLIGGVPSASGIKGVFANVDGATVGLDPDDIRNNYNYNNEWNDQIALRSSNKKLREIKGENISAQLDAEYLLDSDIFSSIKVGFHYSDKTSDTYADSLQNGNTYGDIYLNSSGGQLDFPVDNFLGGSSGSGLPLQGPVTGWAYGSYDLISKTIIDNYNTFYDNPITNTLGTNPPISKLSEIEAGVNPSGSTTLGEIYSSAYIQINVDTLDGKLIGDFGLRSVNTKIDALAYSGETVVSTECTYGILNEDGTDAYDKDLCLEGYIREEAEHDYDVLLPSANFKYLWTEELVSRLSVGTSMSRPRARQLDPSRSINTSNAERATISVGNPELDPIKSWQLDLSLEWYWERGSILSVGLFHKNIEGYIYNQSLRVDQNLVGFNGETMFGEFEEEDGLGGFTVVEREIESYYLRKPINGDTATITGLEARYSHKYNFLPGDWSGLGVDMNYTYADSDAIYTGFDNDNNEIRGNFSFEKQSKHTYNASVYWEKYGHSARLSYNYRTDSLSDAITGAYDSRYNDAYGQMDFSGRYALSHYLRLGLQVTNLLNATNYSYHMNIDDGSPLEIDGYKDRLGSYQFNGRSLRLTIDATF